MATSNLEVFEDHRVRDGEGCIVNDVVIEISTANGTGSQSANLVITRTIFQMGVPVSAKNIFPSNIQGLPTYYKIRTSKAGYTGRRALTDIMICMNPDPIEEDLAGLQRGAILIIRDDLLGFVKRTDIEVISVPFADMVKDVCEVAKLRKMVMNILYVGVLAHVLGLEIEEVQKSIVKVFPGKPKAVDLNTKAMMHAYEWAKVNIDACFPYRVQRMYGATDNKILIEGNQAAAMGAVWGGLTVLPWYPITPSSSSAEYIIDYLQAYRHDPETGKATYAVVQAEDEIASMGMVVGAGWAGARAMTCTSGPGISLMAEMAGLSYFAEIPAVILDVQRVGPSTGLPTRTCQSDILKAYYLSHGDCRHICLIPGDPAECFKFTAEALNLAERFQTLVFVLSDLDLGMNLWMSDTFEYPDKPIDRGKVLDAEALEAMEQKGEEFKRYADVDGDGIPYRTLPGTPHPKAAYFTRGTGHTDKATYSERPHHWQDNMERLKRKLETARRELPMPVLNPVRHANIGIIAYGSSDAAVKEACDMLAEREHLKAEYLRIRALPIHEGVYEFINRYHHVYVVEQNRDAQMMTIMRSERPDLANRMHEVLNYNGLSIDAITIYSKVLNHMNRMREEGRA